MIRWIVQDRLGTGAATQAIYLDATRIDVRHLVDGPGNDPHEIARLIADGTAALDGGQTVLVLCDFGVSRSNALAAGMLARWQALPFDTALARVITATGETQIKSDMAGSVRTALGEVPAPKDARSEDTRLLVTGASGFLGRAVMAELPPQAHLGPSRAELDLTAPVATLETTLKTWLVQHGIDRVLHLAYPRIYTNNAAVGEALSMQLNLMDACRALDLELILVSAGVFSGHDTAVSPISSDPVPPDAPRRARGVFGQGKALQESLLEMAVAVGRCRGRIVRLPALYGPGGDRPRLIRTFAQTILDGQPVRVHRFDDGPAMLELLHVRDAAKGLARMAASDTGPIVHLGSPDWISPAEIAHRIAAILDREAIVEEIAIAGPADRIRLDWQATQTQLGWAPEIAFEDGLRETVEHLLTNGLIRQSNSQPI